MKPTARWMRLVLILIIVCGLVVLVKKQTVKAVTPVSVVINEIAWMGTVSSTSDEWIELYNNSSEAVDLTGWSLVAQDGDPNILLSGTISAGSYFLMERTDDTAVFDVTADFIYTGNLGNTGEVLELYDGSGVLMDTVNSDGGDWPGGDNTTKATLERTDPATEDSDSIWGSNNGITTNGIAADGSSPIIGTPKSVNSIYGAPPSPTPSEEPSPTPTGEPEPTPTEEPPPGTEQVVINEVAWSGTVSSADDEWIELYNYSGSAVDLTDWTLAATDGTPNIPLVGSIPAGGYYLLERSSNDTVSNIVADYLYSGALGNSGESLELRNSSGGLVDTANGDGGGWPAGLGTERMSMERIDPLAADTDDNWETNDGITINGIAADGSSPILGTPKSQNSVYEVTPSPTPSEEPSPTPSEEPEPTPTEEPPTPTPTEEPTPTPTEQPSPTPTPLPGKARTYFSLLGVTCAIQQQTFDLGGFSFKAPKLVCVRDSGGSLFGH